MSQNETEEPEPEQQEYPGLSAEEIGEIEARVTEATPGLWAVFGTTFDGGYKDVYNQDRSAYICSTGENNAVFIAHARTDIPRLLATIRERDERIEELEGDLDSETKWTRHYSDMWEDSSTELEEARGVVKAVRGAQYFLERIFSTDSHLRYTSELLAICDAMKALDKARSQIGRINEQEEPGQASKTPISSQMFSSWEVRQAEDGSVVLQDDE